MNQDLRKGRRRSIRLEDYDYSQPGAYLVTICVQDRQPLLGEIAGEEMRLNEAGAMVARWWTELSKKFPFVQTDESIVMPNHFHGIAVIVGAALRGRPKETGRPHRGAPTLGDVVDWFKTMTTNEYIRRVKTQGWTPFTSKLWQRNYFERVIRNERELNLIRQYIADNPAQWALDRENPLFRRGSHIGPPEKGRPRRGAPTDPTDDIEALFGGVRP